MTGGVNTRALVARAQAGDHKARDELLRHYERTVAHQCRKVARQWGIEPQDAEQEARIRLLAAIDAFDLTREGSSLNAYVSASIRRAALRAVPHRDAVDRSPHAVTDAPKVATVARRLRADGLDASYAAIATELGWTVGRVQRARELMDSSMVTSMDASVGDDEDGQPLTLHGVLADPAPGPDQVAERVIDTERLGARISAAIARVCTPGEAEAVREHVMKGRMLREISGPRGVSHQAVALQVKRGMEKLREALIADGVTGVTAFAGE